MKKYLKLLLIIPFLMAFQCDSEDPAAFDNLESIGLFGRWEIQDEVINGIISDMIPRCCEFLEFEPDVNIRDNRGLLSYTDSQGLVNTGVFDVDIDHQTVLFIDQENDHFIFNFSLVHSQEILTLNFAENGTNITQSWVRIE